MKFFEKKEKSNIKENFLLPREKLMQLSDEDKTKHLNFIREMKE